MTLPISLVQRLPQKQGDEKPADRSTITRCILALLPGLVYVGLLAWLAQSMDFLSDDWGLIDFSNFSLKELFSTNWHGVQGNGGFYRPVTKLSFYLNYLLFGHHPSGFHVTNVIIHALNSLLIFVLSSELFPKSNFRVPLASAYLFLILPIHTDSVYWIAARTDSLCALLFFLTIFSFLRYLREPSPLALAGTIVFFSGALFSKEMAWTLPGILFLVALFRGSKSRRALVVAAVSVVLSYGAYFILRYYALGVIIGRVANNADLSLHRITESMLYLKALFRMGGFRPGGILGAYFVLAGTIGLFLLQIRSSRVRRDVLLLAGLFTVSLIPVIGLMMRWYLYIPSAFACLAVGRVWLGISDPKTVRRIITTVFLLVLIDGGGTLLYEGRLWQEASGKSRAILAAVEDALRETPGRVFLVNLPATFAPPDTIGEKPLFAYHLREALALTFHRPVEEYPTVVSQVHLTSRDRTMSSLKALDGGAYRVRCDDGGFFSTHIFGAFKFREQIRYPWGVTTIRNLRTLFFRITIPGWHRILFFDGLKWTMQDKIASSEPQPQP